MPEESLRLDLELVGLDADRAQDLIIDRAAEKLLNQYRDPDGLRARVKELAEDAITTEIAVQLSPMVNEALNGPIKLTDRYGSPTGKTATLRELIMEQAEKSLTVRSKGGSNSLSTHDMTVLERMIYAEVPKVVKEDLDGSLGAARTRIRDALTADAAKQLAARIADVSF